jgi:hypothetical protein
LADRRRARRNSYSSGGNSTASARNGNNRASPGCGNRYFERIEIRGLSPAAPKGTRSTHLIDWDWPAHIDRMRATGAPGEEQSAFRHAPAAQSRRKSQEAGATSDKGLTVCCGRGRISAKATRKMPYAEKTPNANAATDAQISIARSNRSVIQSAFVDRIFGIFGTSIVLSSAGEAAFPSEKPIERLASATSTRSTQV